MRAGRRVLLRAVAHAEARRWGSAREEVRAALASEGEDGVLQLAAAHVLHVTRDHQEGIDALAAARRLLPSEARRILRRAIACAESLGWEREVAGCCAEGRRVAPRDAAWDALLLAMHRRGGDDEAALGAAERALRLAPRWAALQLERAGILARLGRREEAVAASEVVLAGAPADAWAYRCEAARVLAEAGAFVGAAEIWRSAQAAGVEEAAGALAELCLRAGDGAGARAYAAALAGAGALRVAGALDMSLGTWSSALVGFERALALEVDPVTQLWRAEALLRLGRDAEAGAALTAAGVGGRADNFVAGMLRLLLAARVSPGAALAGPQVEGFVAALSEMGVGEVGGTLAEAAAQVEAGLGRMGGSREPPLSWRAGHVPGDRLEDLRRFCGPGGPRHAARSLLGTIRSADAEVALTRFAGLLAAYPGSALPVCHRGELRLWLGDVDGAARDLDAAIAIVPHTRWAYIGRTMVALLRGEPEAALAEDRRGVAIMGGEGPAVHVHRGEALRRLGRVDAAIAELRRAVALHPGRIGAWLNLGLAHAARGDAGELAAVFERMRERCPGLVSDAARACGFAVWRDPDDPAPVEVQAAVLARALEMLRGNRSSSLVTYFDASGQLRVAQDGAPAGQGPHAHDARDLAQAAALVRA